MRQGRKHPPGRHGGACRHRRSQRSQVQVLSRRVHGAAGEQAGKRAVNNMQEGGGACTVSGEAGVAC